ncbi:MAG: ABC transporter ATP-binding protein [Dehalococcoidia bacterium]
MSNSREDEPTTGGSEAGGPTLEVRGVSRWYGNLVAVNDISFDLSPGITGLLGPNGAGKSTLLHMMAGLLKPSAGEVRILGRSTWHDPELYRSVGIALEREAVYRSLSGYGFVLLNARLHGLPDPHAATKRAIAVVEMDAAQDRATGGYSKGMKQRIKVAAAIVHDPPVLLLDEPFSGADPSQRLHMMDVLRRMASEGRTIVFSSHILEEMEQLGENVLVIVAGRLAASGDFRAIRRLMTHRPHTFSIRSSDNQELARSLLSAGIVSGLDLEDGKLVIRTSDFGRFTLDLPRAAKEAGIELTEVDPLDESLESVFSYLVTS